jgi:hypothetical protein
MLQNDQAAAVARLAVVALRAVLLDEGERSLGLVGMTMYATDWATKE